MLEKRLEKAYNTWKELKAKCAFWSVCLVLGVTAFLATCTLILLLPFNDISDTVIIVSFFIFIGSIIITFVTLFGKVIPLVSNLSDNEKEISDILFRQSLPTKFYRDVSLNFNTIFEFDIASHAKNLRIRYVESQDCIEYKFKSRGRKYHGFMDIDLAQEAFDCEVLKQF